MSLPALIALWLCCACAAAVIGARREAGGRGFVIGLLLGPLGVIAAFALDARPACTRCSSRCGSQAEVCPVCSTAIERLPEATSSDLTQEEQAALRLRHRRGLPPRA